MKLFFTLSIGVLIFGSLTGCCYHNTQCNPCTGGNPCGGYWTATCGGPLDPLGVNCNSYDGWNRYGQCVDKSPAQCQNNSCGCQTENVGNCSNGSFKGNQQGYTPQPVPEYQEKAVPTPSKPAPPALPKVDAKAKPQAMQPVPQRIREARNPNWIPATF